MAGARRREALCRSALHILKTSAKQSVVVVSNFTKTFTVFPRFLKLFTVGNVTPPPPPGSTSPVTPFNYIEWTGVGTLKGIQGNKLGTIPVYFNARTEDRNEPGSKDSNAGSGIDRYYLHVYSDPADPAGSTLLLVNGDANPLNVVPVEIDHGNFQLHISSCDNPPTP